MISISAKVNPELFNANEHTRVVATRVSSLSGMVFSSLHEL